jgi:hypothetical protein
MQLIRAQPYLMNEIRKLVEIDNSSKRVFNETDKAWYVPYRLVGSQIDNFKTVIDPAGCVNVQARTWGNIRMDTSHNQVETAGRIVELYNEIDPILGVVLNAVVRYGENDYLTDSNGKRITKDSQGNEIRNAAHAYELGIIKGVSIDFHPIEVGKTGDNRPWYRMWNLNRVAALTTLTADVPGQGVSGELQGANYRSLGNDSVTNYKELSGYMIRCLCDLPVGAFGRSTIDNQYVEILNITGEGDGKEFKLRNVLTNDEFTTKYDDHFKEVTADDVTNRISEILIKQESTRTFDEKEFSELRACQTCQAKMAKRNADLLLKQEDMKKTKITKRAFIGQKVKQVSTDKIGTVTGVVVNTTDETSKTSVTVDIEGVTTVYIYKTDNDTFNSEFQEVEAPTNDDTVPPAGTLTDQALPTAGEGESTNPTRDMPIPPAEKVPPAGTDGDAITLDFLKSQIESMQSTITTLMTDVEALKAPATRATPEEEESKRIEANFERLFSQKTAEVQKTTFKRTLEENEEKIKNANEEIARAFRLSN